MKFATLVDWKTRRQDKKTEAYWRRQEEDHTLTVNEEYQKEWNFIEKDYPETPSNNGLGLGNPGFAFHTSLAKYIKIAECEINYRGHIIKVTYLD